MIVHSLDLCFCPSTAIAFALGSCNIALAFGSSSNAKGARKLAEAHRWSRACERCICSLYPTPCFARLFTYVVPYYSQRVLFLPTMVLPEIQTLACGRRNPRICITFLQLAVPREPEWSSLVKVDRNKYRLWVEGGSGAVKWLPVAATFFPGLQRGTPAETKKACLFIRQVRSPACSPRSFEAWEAWRRSYVAGTDRAGRRTPRRNMCLAGLMTSYGCPCAFPFCSFVVF